MIQISEDFLGGFVGGPVSRADADFRIQRRLIRAVDASEIPDLAGACLLVEAFDIAAFCHFQRSIDMDFDEFAFWHQAARELPLSPEGRDKRDQCDEARIGH